MTQRLDSHEPLDSVVGDLSALPSLTISPNGNGHLRPMLPPIDLAWLLWRKRQRLFRVTFAGLLVFTAVAFLLPKRYTATTRLMPPDSDSMSALEMAMPALSSGDAGNSTQGGSIMGMASRLLGLNTSGSLFVGVLQSRTIEDDMISRFGLMRLYSAAYPEDARKRLESLTIIKSDADTGIISLSVEDKDPKRAAAMANAYVQDLNQVLATVNTSAAHRERLFLGQRLAQVKNELDASAKDFSEFASANTAINIPEQGRAMVAAAADLQAQLIASESMLRGLQQIYTDNNARVRQMRAQVEELSQQLDKLGGKDVNPNGAATLPKNELYPSIRELPLLGVKYLDLYRRNRVDEAVFELLTKQYEIAKMEEARDVPSVQVLDPAVVPQKKSFPHRLSIMLGGLSASFMLASLWLIGTAYWERTDAEMPWKAFAREVYATTGAALRFRKIARLAIPWQGSNHGNGAYGDREDRT